MNSRQLPKQQKPTAAERNAAASRRASSISRIAHELINQLSALNLVGSNVIAGTDARRSARHARDKEMFQRSVHEATALAEQLAHYVSTAGDDSQPILEAGKVVRITAKRAPLRALTCRVGNVNWRLIRNLTQS
jgi:hypothetical protein